MRLEAARKRAKTITLMRQCYQCEKASVLRGKRRLLRGHYNPTPKARKYPNLQYAVVGGRRRLVCTRCIRTLAKTTSAKK